MASRLKTVLKIVGAGALGIVVLVVLLGVGGYLWLGTPSGQSFVASQVERQFASTFRGSLEVERVLVRLGLWIELRGVRLFDGDGHSVATLRRAAAHVDLWPLLRREVSVRDVVIEAPRFLLEKPASHPASWSVEQAFESRVPAKEEKDEVEDVEWKVRVAGVRVSEGAFRMVPAPEETALRISEFGLIIPELFLSTRFPMRIDVSRLHFVAETGALRRPLDAVARLEILRDRVAVEHLELRSGPLRLSGEGSLARIPGVPSSARLTLGAPAGSLADFGVPNPEPWSIFASIEGPLEALRARLDADAARAGKMAARLEGSFADLEKASYALSIALREADASALGLELPPSRISADLAVRGRGGLARDVEAELEVPEGRVGEIQVRSARLEAAYTPERVVLRTLRLDALDLQATARGTATRLAAGWLPEFSFSVRGPLPTAPKPTQPRAAQGRPAAPLFIVSQGKMRDRVFDVSARLWQGANRFVATRLAGEMNRGLDRIDLSLFEVSYPRNRWTSQEPFSVGIGPRTTLSGLHLASGRQTLGLDASWGDARHRLALDAGNLDLGQFPLDLFTPDIAARGVISARVRSAGTLSFPTGSASLSLSDAGFEMRSPDRIVRLDDISASLDATLGTRRLGAALKAAWADTRAEVRFEGSRRVLDGFDSQESISADVSLNNLDVEDVLAFAASEGEPPRPMGGKLAADLTLSGPLSELEARGRLNLAEGRFEEMRDLALEARFELAQRSSFLDASLREGAAELLSARARWTPPPGTPAFFGVPERFDTLGRGVVDLEARLVNLDLSRFIPQRARPDLGGIVSAAIRVTGALEDPKARVELQGRGLPPLAQGGISLTADYAARNLRLDAFSFARPENTLSVDAAVPVGLDLASLQRGEIFDPRSPVSAEVRARATDLSVLESLVPGVRRLAGILDGNVKVTGNALAPVANGWLRLDRGAVGIRGFRTLSHIRLASRFLGNAVSLDELSVLSGGRAVLKAELTGLDAPTRRFRGSFSSDDFMAIPVRFPDATLTTRVDFDGTLSPEAIAARVRLDARKGLLLLLPNLTSFRSADALTPNEDIVVVEGGGGETPEKSREGALPVTVEGGPQAAATAAPAVALTPVPAEPSMTLSLEVVAPRNIRLEGPDVQLELGLEGFKLRTDPQGEVVMAGRVRTIREGRLELIGRTVRIQESEVQFPNAAPDQARLDVNAAAEISPFGQAIVAIEGSASKPDIELRASQDVGPKTNDEVAMALLTGAWPQQGTAGFVSDRIARIEEDGESAENGSTAQTEGGSPVTGAQGGESSDEAGPGVASRAASIGAGAVASVVSRRLQNLLAGETHLMVNLNVENITDAERREASVQVGRYVSPRLFVGYENRVVGGGKEDNKNQINVDYRLSRRWTLEGSYGDANEGGVSVVWRRHF